MAKMMNNNLMCEENEVNQESTTGFIVNASKAFRELKVKQSSEEDIPVGSKILVPEHSGTPTKVDGEDVRFIHRSEIIMVL